MLDDMSTRDTVARLHAAAVDGRICEVARSRADTLATRLEQGARIVLLGPDGVGKSELCNAILGCVDDGSRPKTTRVFAPPGAAADSAPLSGDKTLHEIPQGPFGHALVFDVSLSSSASGFAATTAEAIDAADIVLWCTQSFSADEALLWSHASDVLKDRSFLVLTKADLLAEAGVLQARVAALQVTVMDEFHSLFATTTSQISALRAQGLRVTEQHLAASGLKALIDRVARIVTAGHRADLDSAQLFLERQGLTPCDPVALPAQEADWPHTPFQMVHDTVMARAVDLAGLGLGDADDAISDVLGECGAICEELADVMRASSEVSPDMNEWTSVFEDASDKIMLMTTENDTRSAADAVTILLQLRRDLEYMGAR